MPSTMSKVIPVVSPRDTSVLVVLHPEKGRMVLAVETTRRLATLEFDAAGWRALHAALGFPPPDVVVAPLAPKSIYHCPHCGKLKLTRKGLPHACPNRA